ncbi:MAG: EAL domain-containing protein [Candidatus Nitricoxidivorans perseverans]|uniref:EAL domain-containing protein n=1 Tax=Candidatus Nitricoxidivorans perseverans TaxID=2975601 RepID=A0AA49IYC6_9PROT|nr:MAG: EAL domain-containing protein [Candidatus Nitricoxidivorans perseverans]
MYRQLWLAIIVSMCLALAGSLFASLLSARGYLEQQLGMKNADNAAALALALSQQSPDAVMVELAAAALFDSGHYESIHVTDPFGKTIVERTAPTDEYDVPAWFARSLPIKAPPGVARISSGWKQFGTVTLVSHSRFAYRALWKSALEMLGALVLAGIIGGLLGSMILRRLRRPLQAVIDQARAITERRFITIPEPEVPELRQLAGAMNATVERLKAMFDEEAARLEAVRQEANFDPLTGLANRDYFMARLRAVAECDESTGGSLFLVRIADLADINRRIGRAATDDLLRRIGSAVGARTGQHADGLAGHLNGADFALLLPGGHGARIVADDLLQSLVQEASPFIEHGPTAFIGFGSFGCDRKMDSLLAQVDAALAGVQAEGANGVREAVLAGDDEVPRSAGQWAQLIRRALDQHWVRLIDFPVTDMAGGLIHRECPLRLMLDGKGEWLPAGRFLPMAERLKLTPEIDLAAVTLGLEQLSDNPAAPGLAVNLSASSIHDGNFRRQLRTLLDGQHAADRLWLGVAETGALKYLSDFRLFCRELDGTGCKLGLKHFGRQFSQIGQLHDLALDYLKVDASFVRGIDGHAGNQAFLKGLAGIAHGIGLTVLAEGVLSEAELATLAELGFDGATGPAVKDTAP